PRRREAGQCRGSATRHAAVRRGRGRGARRRAAGARDRLGRGRHLRLSVLRRGGRRAPAHRAHQHRRRHRAGPARRAGRGHRRTRPAGDRAPVGRQRALHAAGAVDDGQGTLRHRGAHRREQGLPGAAYRAGPARRCAARHWPARTAGSGPDQPGRPAHRLGRAGRRVRRRGGPGRHGRRAGAGDQARRRRGRPAPRRDDAMTSAFLAREHGHLIGGQWRPSVCGRTLTSVNPATGRPLATFARGGAADVDVAVDAARAALADPAWRDLTPLQRGDLLYRLAQLVDEHVEELATIESLDNGKPVAIARAVDCGTTSKLFRYFAGWPSKFEGSTIPVSPRNALRILNYTVHEPIGVVGAIVPWNFPMSMASWKLAPALAMGNTVVLKPAEETPLSTLRLAELAIEAGFPRGVVNVITGTGAEAGAAIAAHPGIDKVAFTGSTETGRQIVRAAAGNMKKVSLELGGKSPHIVLPDADIAAVAAAAADGIFFNAGQVCTAGSRLYVHSAVHDEVTAAVAERARVIVVGPGTEPATQMGPLVSARQLGAVSSYIEAGLAAGATLVAGGGRPPGLAPEY